LKGVRVENPLWTWVICRTLRLNRS
jgi:hypothetical protein